MDKTRESLSFYVSGPSLLVKIVPKILNLTIIFSDMLVFWKIPQKVSTEIASLALPGNRTRVATMGSCLLDL